MNPLKLQPDDLGRLSPQDFRASKKFPYRILLDDIRSLHNVGSVFRTADAFAAEGIILAGITGQPPHREISKTALGADETVAWQHTPNAADFCATMQAEGYKIVVIEQVTTSVQLTDYQPDEKVIFVFGNEVFGVQESIIALADVCVEIPQFGTKHSLNIAVSVGIVCWDYLQKIQG